MTSEHPLTVDAWRAGGSYFDFRGRRVFFRREGSGIPLLCVHGYPTSSWDFHKVWAPLTERFDVFTADMLGFGLTDKPIGYRYSIYEQADLLYELLRRHDVSALHLLCHDYGVSVGQELLARFGDGEGPKLHSVTFLNGGLFPETHRARAIQRLLASPLGPLVTRFSTEVRFRLSLRELFGPSTQPTDGELRQLYQLVERADGKRALADLIAYMEERKANRERWVGAFVKTKVPMTVINGSLDPVSGAHMITRLLELRPATPVVRLDVGHFPQLEAPEVVLDAFLQFIDAVDAK